MSVSQKAVRILNKLGSYGADTEKKITALTYPEIMKICKDSKTLAFQDMELIVKLQEDIKARKVISFMHGSFSDEEETTDQSKEKEEKEDVDAENSDEKEETMAGRQLHSGSREPGGTEGVY